ncbi:putative ORFan [Tupanvirus deep ocean]|uniref:ORFan n=2 Tax=Tupanvirus TaxID=2094720 RepID=A0AC62A9B4_9VIRU|nr:putative ORFan [Tupanvirus deep ocean]QKU34371.1 putative ORFan [Tupanvirus deep ocean]
MYHQKKTSNRTNSKSANYVSPKTIKVAEKLVSKGIMNKSHLETVKKTRFSTKEKDISKHRGFINQVNKYLDTSFDPEASRINNTILHYWDHPHATEKGFRKLKREMNIEQHKIENKYRNKDNRICYRARYGGARKKIAYHNKNKKPQIANKKKVFYGSSKTIEIFDERKNKYVCVTI